MRGCGVSEWLMMWYKQLSVMQNTGRMREIMSFSETQWWHKNHSPNAPDPNRKKLKYPSLEQTTNMRPSDDQACQSRDIGRRIIKWNVDTD